MFSEINPKYFPSHSYTCGTVDPKYLEVVAEIGVHPGRYKPLIKAKSMPNSEISAKIWNTHHYGNPNKYPTYDKYLFYFHANSFFNHDIPYTIEESNGYRP